MIEFIDWRVFIISLAVGLLFVYLVEPPMKTIYVFPTPENVEKIQYKDHVDTCFDFKPIETDCNNANIENYVVQ